MYKTKILKPTGYSTLVYQSTWLVEETLHFDELIICENARLCAPEGKHLTLTVNGIGKPIEKGTYKGDVVLSVTDDYALPPGGLMMANQISRTVGAAVVVENGKVSAGKSVSAIAQDGTVSDTCADGLYVGTSEGSFNGVVVADSEYKVTNCRFDFEGFSDNDFLGVGCGVTAVGKSKVEVDNCEFNFSGVTRCAVHAGGDSDVTVRNSRLINLSPDSHWLGSFSWQVGFAGTNRLAQLCDNATVTYDNCDMITNGWGVCSIDGSDEGVHMFIKNSRLELTGPRAHGYGTFCIGDNDITIENSTVDVNGYPIFLMGMEGKGHAIISGSKIRGRRFGSLVASDDHSIFDIKDSDFDTGKSSLVVKGSATTINVENTTMKAGNNVILQLMDSDEGGMAMSEFYVPVGVEDKYVEGRELSKPDANDIYLNISRCELKGDIFNSTTSLRPTDACPNGGMGYFHDTVVGYLPPRPMSQIPDSMPAERDDNRGPKNLALTLRDTKIEGIISSAKQAYRDGLTVIREDNRLELSNIRQWAAPTVNNGVIVDLDSASVWTVTGTSYITGLKLAQGALVKAPEGKKLSVTVDGKPVELAAGEYSGKIVLEVC